MKLSFDYKNFKPLKKILSNISILLWLFLGLVLLLVVWVVFSEVAKITQSQIDLSSAQSKIVRVNMDKYKEVSERLNENASFSPRVIPGTDAFLPLPTKRD